MLCCKTFLPRTRNTGRMGGCWINDIDQAMTRVLNCFLFDCLLWQSSCCSATVSSSTYLLHEGKPSLACAKRLPACFNCQVVTDTVLVTGWGGPWVFPC